MARRRGFFAELEHQNKLANQRRLTEERERAAAARRMAQAAKARQRTLEANQRTVDADAKRMAKEAAAAHIAAQQAETERLNSELYATYESFNTLLDKSLAVDSFIDLETLRKQVVHPPFDGQGLELPNPEPELLLDPTPPSYQPPATPSGLFGRKKKLVEAQAEAQTSFDAAKRSWALEMEQLPGRRLRQAAQYAAAEQTRVTKLERLRRAYVSQCATRDKSVHEQNTELDSFIANLSYGTVEAVQDYFSIVLGASVYPAKLEMECDVEFDPQGSELSLRMYLPEPSAIPSVKNYRYVKASDEIASTALSQKDSKDRYTSIVHQVALRTIHEVFLADRRKLIQGISIDVGTNTIAPATGKETYVPFVAAAVNRPTFLEIELSAVTPSATLEHLGGTTSKNPLGLVPANTTGVRRS